LTCLVQVTESRLDLVKYVYPLNASWVGVQLLGRQF